MKLKQLTLPKIASNWRDRLLRSYSSLSIIANILVALSVTGLSVIGVVASEIALPMILLFAIPFGLIGLIGRVIDQGLDDVKCDVRGGE